MPQGRVGWLLDEMADAGRENLDAKRFEIEEAVYSEDGIFAKYVLRAA